MMGYLKSELNIFLQDDDVWRWEQKNGMMGKG